MALLALVYVPIIFDWFSSTVGAEQLWFLAIITRNLVIASAEGTAALVAVDHSFSPAGNSYRNSSASPSA